MENTTYDVWEDYKTIRGGEFSYWFEGLSPIQREFWLRKFKSLYDNTTESVYGDKDCLK